MLQIRCTNNNQTKSFPEGSSLLEIFPEFRLDFKYPVVSAKVNNTSQGLKFRLWQNRDVEFVDIRNPSGMRAYIRSLCFVLYKAAQDVFPGCKLFIEHPLSRGYYCNFVRNFKNITANSPENKRGLTGEEVERVRQRMQEIIDLDMPFRRNEAPTEEAIRIFKERGFIDKVRLLETSEKVYTDYYTLGDTVDYYYGSLVPSAGYLKVFGLEPYGEGMLLRVPDKENPGQLAEMTPQPMTFDVYKEQVRWNVIMHLSNVGDVNKACQNGRAPELIQVSEALQEKKIVKIAEEIELRYREQELKVVLITGPSSSGKTTFCKRLSIQLLACGLRPISFSTDDYFVNRADTPLLPNGQYDFDNFETVDHKLLGSHLVQLLEGKEVEVPEYNFTTGMREWNGKKLRIKDKHILIIEGIHALNPRLTENIPDCNKYKIYTSALTNVSLDDHNWIPTRDNRLLRRIIRDYNKGAFSARETIKQWPNVCAAEEKWIFPYQENADATFNSSLLFELGVIKEEADRVLSGVPRDIPEYAEASRLRKFLSYFAPIGKEYVPSTSLIREFIGGSSFTY